MLFYGYEIKKFLEDYDLSCTNTVTHRHLF